MKRWVDRLEQLESTLKEFLKAEWKGVNSTVVSKFSGGKPVEKSRLYEYFLSVWLEYDGLRGRLERALRVNEVRLPPRSNSIGRIEGLLEELFADRDLEGSLTNHLVSIFSDLEDSMRGTFSNDDSSTGDQVEDVLSILIRADQSHACSRELMERTERGPATNLRMVDGRIRSLAGAFADHSPFVRERVRERLQNYRINTLNLKHLQNTQEQGLIDLIMYRSIDESDRLLLDELESKFGEIDGTMRGLLEILGEIGFDELLEDVTEGDSVLTGNQLGGISILPGEGGSCSKTLLALARGNRKPHGFDAILKRVNEYLISCDHVTEYVIFLTDYWDSKKFADDHHSCFQAWHTKSPLPKTFIFLTVGVPRTKVSLIRTDLM
jgi:Arc/MetJ-type ribon-helix-helix transcriptional regulator